MLDTAANDCEDAKRNQRSLGVSAAYKTAQRVGHALMSAYSDWKQSINRIAALSLLFFMLFGFLAGRVVKKYSSAEESALRKCERLLHSYKSL